MLDLLVSLLLVLAPPVVPHRTVATRYDYPSDPTRGGMPACWRRCLESAPSADPQDRGAPVCARRFPAPAYHMAYPVRVAHRDLPCGTIVLVQSAADSSRAAFGVVLDRGPYGRVRPPSTPHLQNRARTRPAARAGSDLPAHRPATPTLNHGSPARSQPYRGDLDLSPRVADALGLSLRVGRLPIRWWIVGRVGD